VSRFAAAAALAVVLASCSSSSGSGLTPLGSAQAGAITVQLYTATQLATGLSPVYAKLTDASGAGVTTAVVTFVPTMTMTGGGTHTAPVVGPVNLNNEFMFQGYVMFPMASGAMGSWSMKVGVQILPAVAPTYANFPSLPVAETGCASTFASGGTTYALSFNLKSVATVGMNPVVDTLFSTTDSGATYTPVNDASLVLVPCVPSASHCSSGSVNPAFVSDGTYNGQVNFDRSGSWVTEVQVRRGGSAIGTASFNTTF
jgi:hypothetical protein